MTVNLETEVISTGFDVDTASGVYTIQRGTKRWTIKVPLAVLEVHKGNAQARRTHLANALEAAISQQDPDPEAVAARPPENPQ
jgi:hypothetical protein